MDFIILEDLKIYLNIGADDTTSDYLLTSLIAPAIKFVESYCQRSFVIREFTDRFTGTFCDFHVLNHYPANSILEISIDGVKTNDYSLEDDIVYLSEKDFCGKCIVKYEVGYTADNIPADLKQACIELACFWYKKKDTLDLASKNLSQQTTTHINKDMPEFIKAKLINYEAKF